MLRNIWGRVYIEACIFMQYFAPLVPLQGGRVVDKIMLIRDKHFAGMYTCHTQQDEARKHKYLAEYVKKVWESQQLKKQYKLKQLQENSPNVVSI